MITFKQFQDNWWRLKETEDDDIFNVMGSLLSSETKTAILADLNDVVEGAMLEALDEYEDTIRRVADKLPVDDPLRIAIEEVPE